MISGCLHILLLEILNSARVSTGSRPAGQCNCERAPSENGAVTGEPCPCGKRASGEQYIFSIYCISSSAVPSLVIDLMPSSPKFGLESLSSLHDVMDWIVIVVFEPPLFSPLSLRVYLALK